MKDPTVPKTSPLLLAWSANRAALLRYFTLRLRSPEVAEDLLHDLYVKIASCPPEAQIEDPVAYLFRAGRNLLINYIRGHQRGRKRENDWASHYVTAVGGDFVVPLPSPEKEVLARQELSVILRIVDTLSPQTRTIFRLHRLKGMTQAQIALQLSVSKRTVETHLATALKHLMTQLPPELRRPK